MFGYGAINKFINETTITEKVFCEKACGDTIIKGKPEVHCYSLTKTQKAIFISIIALAIVAIVVGAYSLGGANLIGNKAAWAMVGVGSGVAAYTVGGMTINHLLFVKTVGKYLADQKDWDCADGAAYPEEKSKAHRFQVENSFPHFFKTYSNSISDLKKAYHIEFYRTHPDKPLPKNKHL